MIRELKSFFPWRSWRLGGSLKKINVHNSNRIAIDDGAMEYPSS